MKGNILKWNINEVLDDQNNRLRLKKSHLRELRNVSHFSITGHTMIATRLIHYTLRFYTNIRFSCFVSCDN